MLVAGLQICGEEVPPQLQNIAALAHRETSFTQFTATHPDEPEPEGTVIAMLPDHAVELRR